jgi:hypothetical protein
MATKTEKQEELNEQGVELKNLSTELNKPALHKYNNADHVEFHEISYVILNRNKAVIAAQDLITAYQTKVTQETQVLNWIRSSEFTAKKAQTDHERDTILAGIIGILHSYEKHFDSAVRDNAKHILNLVNNYHNVAHTDYDAETASLDNLITRLKSSAYLPAVQNLQLLPWVTELTRLNTLFKTYAANVEQEEVVKPAIHPKAARKETDEALRKITNRITALIEINGPNNYKTVVTEFNVHVNHYNTLVHEHYGRLHARTDISQGEVATIPDQPYTGKPTYVIPSVKVHKKAKDGTITVVDLIFSVDFTVGYKNNLAPGTATLIISGIGQYVGEIVTTFNIV